MTTPLECADHLRQETIATPDQVLPLFGDRLSRGALYAHIRAGTFPVTPVRLGRRVLIPVQPLLAVLGLDDHNGELTSGGSYTEE